MKTKLVLKLSILLVGLILVAMYRNFAESGGMIAAFNSLFGISKTPTITWCVSNAVDVLWTSEEVPEKLKSLEMSELRGNYCELSTETIHGVDLNQVQWASLAESSGPTGIKTVLEWNKELGLFRTGGLPFKSSNLSRELVDK
ncbi:MAG: hypothetical protein AABY53_08275 [Bdellovibrionota bacterium]